MTTSKRLRIYNLFASSPFDCLARIVPEAALIPQHDLFPHPPVTEVRA